MPESAARPWPTIYAGEATRAETAKQRAPALTPLARLRRIVVPGHPHVIVHLGRQGAPVFRDAADRQRYLVALAEAARIARVAVHAYGLWPGEVRLLVSPQGEASLATLMQAVGLRYVRSFNQKYGNTGTPWEGRFRSTVIERQTQFLPCLRFVEGPADAHCAAPAAPGFETERASSAAHHLGLRVDRLVSEHPAIWSFGNTPFERHAAYRRFVDHPAEEGELAAILQAALNGWVLGSPEFAAMVEALTGRRPQRALRGRPRKSVPPAPHI